MTAPFETGIHRIRQMNDPQLSPTLIQFIQATVPSYEAAVLLVFISRQPDRAWTVDDLVNEAGAEWISPEVAGHCVGHFVRSGVLRAVADSFTLVSDGDVVRSVVDELRLAYDRRPVTLIRAIDSAAKSKIQSFADSFKWKKD